MNDLIVRNEYTLAVILDGMLFCLLFATTAISHHLPIPLYLFDPMKLIIILVIVFTNKTNAIFVALAIPQFSLVTSGHPIFPKNILISIELIIFVSTYSLFHVSYMKKYKLAGAILFSKLSYYMLKMGFVYFGILSLPIVSTPIKYQLISTGILIPLYFLATSVQERFK